MRDKNKYYKLIAKRENLVTFMEQLEKLGTRSAMIEYDKLAEAYEQVEAELEEVSW